MGAIKLTQFGGIVPRTSRRLTPDNAAQVAANCRLSSGELIPFNQPKYVADCSLNPETIYRFTDNGAYTWKSWATLAHVIKAPLFGTARWCITGDGAPKITTKTDVDSNTFYTLGVPKPYTKPTVTPSGTGTGLTVSRYYAYTFYTKWGDTELEGAVSPTSDITTGKEDDTWAITGMDALPVSSGSCTASHAAGVTTVPTSTDHWLRVGEEVVLSGTTVLVTEVTSKTVFKVAGDYSAATTWARKSAFPGTFYKRLYRSTGTVGQFQLVAEELTGTTYNDTLDDGAILGDELITADWDMPPVGLTGLILLPSGSLAGFVGNKVYFSEPNQPHAYPSSYTLQVDYPIVSLGSFGTGIAVGTESAPVIINGIEPGQMQSQTWEEIYPCLSAASMVSIGGAALYASTPGIISVSPAGVTIWSLQFFTKHEFDDFNPESMISVLAEGRLYINYTAGTTSRTLIFNLMGDTPYLTEAHFDATAMYADSTTGKLYFSSGLEIKEFDPLDGYAMSQDWMSKEIVMPKPANLGAARVAFDLAIDRGQYAAYTAQLEATQLSNEALVASGEVNGSWNAVSFNTQVMNGSDIAALPTIPAENEILFQLYVASQTGEMELKFSRTVRDSKVFRLPSGYKSNSVAVRVVSQCPIHYIELGGTPSDLATA